jgi:transcriptional regulator with XRE-family HTH domain
VFTSDDAVSECQTFSDVRPLSGVPISLYTNVRSDPQRLTTAAMTIRTEERDYFIALGERIANLRKTHAITQVQLAEALRASQQTVQAYEVGRQRIPVAALPVVERLRQVPMEQLFGKPAAPAAASVDDVAARAHRRAAQAETEIRDGDAGNGAGPGRRIDAFPPPLKKKATRIRGTGGSGFFCFKRREAYRSARAVAECRT